MKIHQFCFEIHSKTYVLKYAKQCEMCVSEMEKPWCLFQKITLLGYFHYINQTVEMLKLDFIKINQSVLEIFLFFVH